MTRVDEALKRARDMTTPAMDSHEADSVRRAAGPGSLDLYPLEQTPRGDATRREHPSAKGDAVANGDFVNRVVSAQFGARYKGKLVTQGASPASIEQYRRLAAVVHHLQGEQGLNRLMVSSSVPQEGKTLTIVNLALTLSESYNRRVLLIDADLRRPSVHDVFGIPNIGGLSGALESESGAVQFVRVSPLLSVIPAGPPKGDPMAALASGRMAGLLDELARDFDWILLDAPPVALMADAGFLVRLTRAVVLVIAAGSTPFTLVEKSIAELGREHIVGTVLNRVDDDAAEGSAYYSGAYK